MSYIIHYIIAITFSLLGVQIPKTNVHHRTITTKKTRVNTLNQLKENNNDCITPFNHLILLDIPNFNPHIDNKL